MLKHGDESKEVGDWQTYLQELSLYTYAIDNKYGDRTTHATKQFQKNKKIPETGRVDNSTIITAITTIDSINQLGFKIIHNFPRE